MTKISRFLLVMMILMAWFPMQISSAAACSCTIDPDLSEDERLLYHYDQGYISHVFVGVVTHIVKISETDQVGAYYEVTLATDQVYKGSYQGEYTIMTADNSAACGYYFEMGGRYLIFGEDPFQNVDMLQTDSCSGNLADPTMQQLAALDNMIDPYPYPGPDNPTTDGMIPFDLWLPFIAFGFIVMGVVTISTRNRSSFSRP